MLDSSHQHQRRDVLLACSKVPRPQMYLAPLTFHDRRAVGAALMLAAHLAVELPGGEDALASRVCAVAVSTLKGCHRKQTAVSAAAVRESSSALSHELAHEPSSCALKPAILALTVLLSDSCSQETRAAVSEGLAGGSLLIPHLSSTSSSLAVAASRLLAIGLGDKDLPQQQRESAMSRVCSVCSYYAFNGPPATRVAALRCLGRMLDRPRIRDGLAMSELLPKVRQTAFDPEEPLDVRSGAITCLGNLIANQGRMDSIVETVSVTLLDDLGTLVCDCPHPRLQAAAMLSVRNLSHDLRQLHQIPFSERLEEAIPVALNSPSHAVRRAAFGALVNLALPFTPYARLVSKSFTPAADWGVFMSMSSPAHYKDSGTKLLSFLIALAVRTRELDGEDAPDTTTAEAAIAVSSTRGHTAPPGSMVVSEFSGWSLWCLANVCFRAQTSMRIRVLESIEAQCSYDQFFLRAGASDAGNLFNLISNLVSCSGEKNRRDVIDVMERPDAISTDPEMFEPEVVARHLPRLERFIVLASQFVLGALLGEGIMIDMTADVEQAINCLTNLTLFNKVRARSGLIRQEHWRALFEIAIETPAAFQASALLFRLGKKDTGPLKELPLVRIKALPLSQIQLLAPQFLRLAGELNSEALVDPFGVVSEA